MMPLPRRALTSLLVRYNGSCILVDCGEATQIALRRAEWSPKPIDVMCFTHYHADHISGLPGMLLTMGNADRTEPLLMIGPKGLERVVNALRTIAPELPFDIRFHELKGTEEEVALPGMPEFHLSAFKVNHNILCYGYDFRLDRAGKFDALKAAALVSDKRKWGRLQKGESVTGDDGQVVTSNMVMGGARKGLHLTYTTDTRPCDNIVKYASGADLFICEGMYGEPGMEEKAVSHKHMTFTEAARLAKQAGVKELWLTHYSPSLIRPQDYVDTAQAIFHATIAPKDGRVKELRFEEETAG